MSCHECLAKPCFVWREATAGGRSHWSESPRRSGRSDWRQRSGPPGRRSGDRVRGIGIAGTTTPLWFKRSCQGTAESVWSGCWFPARSSSPMPYESSSAAGDVGVPRTGSRITRAMQPSTTRGETRGPRPEQQRAGAFVVDSRVRGMRGSLPSLLHLTPRVTQVSCRACACRRSVLRPTGACRGRRRRPGS